ncbi:hypothetical protein PTSG_10355 [Salpingoeca rosetta]|uniref:Poly [ADP-ribose] polymerase n=1 Tax=Salpingoeca rosetta (strain ATCC 50818 / BSB-021) TaxID=946362 RepID=F2UR26_SALR5|nr:uncharacterized protein PTSG_10355 [Salpingoeca rosetta]EGD80081.1 hypothetical protein PTSG_10355 [Salpingoeca rosetta]|eukprot:XP_004988406.1 hypothetical protein PTSG_10355 [Salpingoeca rosetta]
MAEKSKVAALAAVVGQTWREELVALLDQVDDEEDQAVRDKICAILLRAADYKEQEQNQLEVNLSDCRLKTSGARALAIVLRQNAGIKSLLLPNNELASAGISTLAPALQQLTALSILELSGNQLGDDGITALAAALPHLTSLTRLGLASNHIGNTGATALTPTLHHLSSLLTLDLTDNHLSDAGTEAIVLTLRHMPSLTTLNLSRNKITNQGMLAVFQQLQSIGTDATIRLSEDVVVSAAVAKSLATLRTKRPDLRVYVTGINEFDNPHYEEQLRLLKLLETGAMPLDTAKVFVCGDYGIGKTTLIRSLRGAGYLHAVSTYFFAPANDPDRPNERTPGIQLSKLNLHAHANSGRGRGSEHTVASLRVYDFGGQLAYHVIHTLMMSDRFAAFVVCVDLSQPALRVTQRANYWLQFICTRLQQGVAADTATAGGGIAAEVKPRVVIVGTKKDVVSGRGNSSAAYQRALVANLRETFGHIVDIQDALIALNCHQPAEEGFQALRSQLIQHWQWLRSQEVLVPQVVNDVSRSLKAAAKQRPMWPYEDLLVFVQNSGNGLDLISAIRDDIFQLTLRYLHTRGDVLWYSSSPALSDYVFVSPNWLLHDVLGKALQPEGVMCGGLNPKTGVVTLADIEAAFHNIVSPHLVITLLQYALLCFELPCDKHNRRRFMLPSRVQLQVDIGAAWPPSDNGMWSVYAGRRLAVESEALALPPGLFPHVQTRLHALFTDTLKVWTDAFSCARGDVQCLGLMHGDREVDVWVRARAGAECSAWSCMMDVFSLLQDEARGIEHTHLVLSAKDLRHYQPHPAGIDIKRLEDLPPHENIAFFSTGAHHSTPEPVGDLLVRNPVLTARWHEPGYEWRHPAWCLDDSFDRLLSWTGPGDHGVFTAPLPPDTDLYRWIEGQMTQGLTLSRVEVTKSTTILRAFHTRMALSSARRGDPDPSNPFNRDFGAGDPEKQAMLDRLKTQFAATADGGVAHVNVLVGWHGCGEAVTDSIIATGTASLRTSNDVGYFGAGIYLTPQANYAAGYSTRLMTGNWRQPNANGEHVLLLCAAGVGLAYPITRRTDYTRKIPKMPKVCDYYGQPLYSGCDSHYVQVTRSNKFQAADVPGTFDFEEYVMGQEAQVLPIARVFVTVNKNELRSHLAASEPASAATDAA